MITEIKDAQHWHQLRAKHIGASEVSALFNQSPYQTAYSLYQVKRGASEPPAVDTDLTEIGQALEPGIAALYAARNNLELVKVSQYHECDDQPYLGATLDYYFMSHESKKIATEIKSVSSFAWRMHGWDPGEDYLPPSVEMQIVSQMLCTGLDEGRVVALCDGALYSWTRKMSDPRIQKVAESIKEKVSDMKRRVESGDEPDAFGADYELSMMGFIVRSDPNKASLDLTHDTEADNLLQGLKHWQDAYYTAGKEIERYKALVTQMIRRSVNEELVPVSCITENFKLKRTTSPVKGSTIVRKPSVRTVFTVQERTDASLVEPNEDVGKNIMAG